MKNSNKPNFFIVGAARCGTTSLYDYLNQIPEIFMSPNKEPHFFTSKQLPEYYDNYFKISFLKLRRCLTKLGLLHKLNSAK